MCAYICACVFFYVRVRLYTQTYICVHVRAPFSDARVCVRAHMCVRIRMHVRVHVLVCTHIQTHACASVRNHTQREAERLAHTQTRVQNDACTSNRQTLDSRTQRHAHTQTDACSTKDHLTYTAVSCPSVCLPAPNPAALSKKYRNKL